MEALRRWLDAERGRRSMLAASIGVTHGAISQWDRVPDGRVPEVSRVTGIPPHELRPDLADIFAPTPSKPEAA